MKEGKNMEDMNVKDGLSRRSFLGLGAAAAVVAGAGLAGCTSNAPAADSKDEAKEEKPAPAEKPATVDQTIDTDLLIVGGGGSGIVCAIQAALNGTDFVVIEKSDKLGGNAAYTEGMFAIGSKMALEQGIDITAAEIIEDELNRGQYRQNAAFWLDLCNNSAENIDWCLEQGVIYSGVIDNYYGGLHPTFHWFKDGKASIGFVEPLLARVDELGIEYHLNTSATSLIMDGDKVAGAYAQSEENGVVQYNAKAVVLATGGFGGSADHIAMQGWDTEHLFIVGSANTAGDAYDMAMEVGAKDFMPDSAQSILYNIPALPPINFHDDSQNPVNGYFGIAAGGPVLWINEHCDRYSRENMTDDNLVLQCIPGKNNVANYVVFDQAIFDEFFGTDADATAMFMESLADDTTGTLFTAESVEELAAPFDLDVDALTTTVNRYNELCEKGNDDDYGKPAEKMVAIKQAPFYIAKLGYSFFFEVGGITTDRQRRVLDDSSQPIPGLFAIGNDGNMNYRHVYTINMPGTAMGNQVNSGREAANNAMEYLAG